MRDDVGPCLGVGLHGPDQSAEGRLIPQLHALAHALRRDPVGPFIESVVVVRALLSEDGIPRALVGPVGSGETNEGQERHRTLAAHPRGHRAHDGVVLVFRRSRLRDEIIVEADGAGHGIQKDPRIEGRGLEAPLTEP
jgi:hypothetical protein